MNKLKLVSGFGINDANYSISAFISGKQKICPYYRTWKSMVVRCYSEKHQKRYPSYIGCSVTLEWKNFSNFKAWMEQQDWQGKDLDKDLLVLGNKVYSPETCVFLDHMTNSFLVDCAATRGLFPAGVYWHKASRKFKAQCSNPITGEREYLGLYLEQEDAYNAWRKRKSEIAMILAEKQSDYRISDILLSRYL